MRTFENSQLSVYGPVRHNWKVEKMHNEEFLNLYCYKPDIIKVIKKTSTGWACRVGCMGAINTQNFSRKSLRERALWKLCSVREDNIKSGC
jgi:hypothetical protein